MSVIASPLRARQSRRLRPRPISKWHVPGEVATGSAAKPSQGQRAAARTSAVIASPLRAWQSRALGAASRAAGRRLRPLPGRSIPEEVAAARAARPSRSPRRDSGLPHAPQLSLRARRGRGNPACWAQPLGPWRADVCRAPASYRGRHRAMPRHSCRGENNFRARCGRGNFAPAEWGPGAGADGPSRPTFAAQRQVRVARGHSVTKPSPRTAAFDA